MYDDETEVMFVIGVLGKRSRLRQELFTTT